MPKRTWTFSLQDQSNEPGDGWGWTARRTREHTVELRHGYWTARRRIYVDGERLPPERIMSHEATLADSDDLFVVDGHECLVQIRNKGMTYKYAFAVDGISVQNGETIARPDELQKKEWVQHLRMPFWGWGFIAAVVLLGIVAMIAGGVAAAKIAGEFPERARLALLPAFLILISCAALVANASVQPDLNFREKALRCTAITASSTGLAMAVTFVAALAVAFVFQG